VFVGAYPALDLGDGVQPRMYKLSGQFENLKQAYAGQKMKRWGIFQKIFGDSGNIHFRKPSLGKQKYFN
jgi:hypothetical protein